jgi:hypothetical protein
VRVLDQLSVVTSPQRELAHRCGAGLDVTLYWNGGAAIVTVEVLDLATGENFELTVPRSRALDAFHHPFAYVDSCAGGAPSTSLRDR